MTRRDAVDPVAVQQAWRQEMALAWIIIRGVIAARWCRFEDVRYLRGNWNGLHDFVKISIYLLEGSWSSILS